MSETVIKAEGLRKTYRHYKNNFQKIQFLLLMRDVGRKIRVLRGVSFEIKKGEKVCIIGRAQSGKSTLMRILAGAVKPDKGSIEVSGRVQPMLEARFAFDNALTGALNYGVLARMYGWSADEVKEREDGIFKAAELSRFKNDQIKTYRKGAASRLGFMIFTEKKQEIMLFDGGFTFGSKRWKRRCIDRLRELLDDDVTFVMTAGDLVTAAELCTRGIVLHEGKVVYDGGFEDAVSYFNTRCRKKDDTVMNDTEADQRSVQSDAMQEIEDDNSDPDDDEF